MMNYYQFFLTIVIYYAFLSAVTSADSSWIQATRWAVKSPVFDIWKSSTITPSISPDIFFTASGKTSLYSCARKPYLCSVGFFPASLYDSVYSNAIGFNSFILSNEEESNVSILVFTLSSEVVSQSALSLYFSTAPVLTVVLSDGGSGYNIPGAIDTAEDGSKRCYSFSVLIKSLVYKIFKVSGKRMHI